MQSLLKNDSHLSCIYLYVIESQGWARDRAGISIPNTFPQQGHLYPQGCVHSGVAIAQGVPLSSAGERCFLRPTCTFYFTSGPLASPCAAQPLAAFSQPPAHRCRFLPRPKPALFFHLPAWEEPFSPDASEAPPELAPVCPRLSHRGPSWRQHLPMIWGVLSWNGIHVIWCLCSYYRTK